jgi:hypothetical protein
MTTPQARGVHLFRDNILIANMMTTALTPEESYVIDGVTYAVTSYRGPYLQHNGHEGWDVQVGGCPGSRRT